jgi:hypothetical protein
MAEPRRLTQEYVKFCFAPGAAIHLDSSNAYLVCLQRESASKPNGGGGIF